MMASLPDFLYMHGYGRYVFSAYGSVVIFLLVQWFFAWRPWQQYLQRQNSQT